ncbi:MAG: TlpA family protein disulfide reductase [Cytophagales bacterium]|nr:TlpA family protein disulfide reductase [Cytophagales bacterium]
MIRFLFLFLIIIAGCSPSRKESNSLKLEDIRLTDLAGNAVDVSQFKDKTVLVNFWATWCKPCLQEMPSLAATQNRFKDQPIVFLFASNETTEQINRFKNKQKFEFNYLHLGNLEALKIQALPTTFIFDQTGELKFSEIGFRDWTSPASIEIITNILPKP